MAQKIVTKEIQKIIKEKYPIQDTMDLAKELGFSPSTIKTWAQKLGVKKQKIYHSTGKFTKEEKEYIIENYSTKSNQELSRYLNKSVEDILKYACSKGLKKRADKFNHINGALDFFQIKRRQENYNTEYYLGHTLEPKVSETELYKSIHGKYYVNRNYFNRIDNEWKAYWLGFLYADGWNTPSKCSMGLSLNIEDKDHVLKFKDSLQAENKIYFKKSGEVVILGNKVNSKGAVGITINNQQICNDLQKLGCVEHKTYTLQFPNTDIVPNYLMRHFIRGFFDGDGWVSVGQKGIAPTIGFVGMPTFILPLSDYLCETLNLTKVKYSQKQNAKTIEIDWASLVDVEKIYNFLYNDANIFLERKFELLNNFYCLGQWNVDKLT